MQTTSSPSSIGALKAIHVGSLAALGVYGVAMAYRLGVFRKILPASINEAIEKRVERIKAKTEPPTGFAQYKVARSHLLKTYGWAVLGFTLGGAGIAACFQYPYVPIGLMFAMTATPSIILQFVPKNWVHSWGRHAAFAVACFSCGYTMGPVHWIAYDSMVPVAKLVASTIVGFSIPLFLTRGIVSYFVSSQVLSCSLAVATSSPTSTLDVNLVIVLQVLGNTLLGVTHTLPVIAKCLKWSDSLEKLDAELDPMLEGFRICGAVAYGCWTAFRVVCCQILLRVTRDKHSGASKEERSYIRSFANMTLNVDRWSRILASVFSLIVYVRVVSYLQRGGNAGKQLEVIRRVFACFSPLTIGSAPNSRL